MGSEKGKSNNMSHEDAQEMLTNNALINYPGFLKTKREIKAELRTIFDSSYKTRVLSVKESDRKNWEVFCKRNQMENAQFSYIKFAKDTKTKKIYGISGCKTNSVNPDFDFYDIEKKRNSISTEYSSEGDWLSRAKAPYFLEIHNELEWYKDEILIIKNLNDGDVFEAYTNEKLLQRIFNLFD